MAGGRPRNANWWKSKNPLYKREIDAFDQTKSKYVEFENWTGLNYNRNSKGIHFYCDGTTCKKHPEHDPRKLIRHAYEKGFKKCKRCGYFKTRKKNCPCCHQTMQFKMNKNKGLEY